jgi:hypothetical protein
MLLVSYKADKPRGSGTDFGMELVASVREREGKICRTRAKVFMRSSLLRNMCDSKSNVTECDPTWFISYSFQKLGY